MASGNELETGTRDSSGLPYLPDTYTPEEQLHRNNLEQEVFRTIQEYGLQGFIPIQIVNDLLQYVIKDYTEIKEQVINLSADTEGLLKRIPGGEAGKLMIQHQRMAAALEGFELDIRPPQTISPST